MNICGVIAEYNPFHNGHAYQLAEARRLSGCDFLVVVMSGGFSQRGEVMLLDKWTRAHMALENGADLVVELPALFAVRSADAFARGGVHLLAGMGVSSLCFGCETDDLARLNRILDLLVCEDDALRDAIRLRLSQGQSHVRARGEAVTERLQLSPDALSQPNTTLALEYLRANRQLAKPLSVHVVQRTGGYHDLSLSRLSSASAIRAAVDRGEVDAVRSSMPPSAFALLEAASPGRIADMTRLDALLIDRLRSVSFSSLPDVSEGLDRRAAKCAESCGSRASLLSALKCKRYTYARLSRLCAHALLGFTQDALRRCPSPPYARVLGFRSEAKPLLARLADASIPVVTRAPALRDQEAFVFERRATDLQSLCFPDETARSAGRDLTERIVIV